MQISGDYHLSYCTNIHPGRDWEETFQNLKAHLPVIRDRVAEGKKFGVGLRLSNQASAELAEGSRLEEFRNWLDHHQLYVFTMNGFPYGNFHFERVKDQVHAPDWTTKERLEYTLRLFDQLAFLLPENMDGGISTSPVSYRHWFENDTEIAAAFNKGAENLAEVVVRLARLEQETQKYLHLDIEPEPDGLLENTEEVLSFYRDHLLPVAVPVIQETLDLSRAEAANLIFRHITLCYDTCHFALAFEEPRNTFEALKAAGIRTGKIQISAALKILPDTNGPDRIRKALEEFNEPVYLHQVTELREDGVRTWPDLPDLFNEKGELGELRAHFHVPVFMEHYDMLHSTRDQIIKTLEYLKDDPLTRHLEVETYTWDVLPKNLKTGLDEMVSRELSWVINLIES